MSNVAQASRAWVGISVALQDPGRILVFISSGMVEGRGSSFGVETESIAKSGACTSVQLEPRRIRRKTCALVARGTRITLMMDEKSRGKVM